MHAIFVYAKKFMLTLIISLVIFNLFVFIFAIYEYYVNWGKDENWCTHQQILGPPGKAKRSVILIHGFGGSPFDHKPLAVALQKKGFYVTVPVMPNQNKNYFAFTRGSGTPKKYVEWLRNIIAAETNRFGKKPYLVGFSMGGTLSTIVSTENTVEKLVLLAPYYATPHHNKVVMMRKFFGYFVPVLPKPASGRINSKVGRNQYLPGTFLVSVAVSKQLDLLASVARKKVSQIKVKTLVIASENDQVAAYEPIKKLFNKHPYATIKNFPESNHIMLYDNAKEKVVAQAVRFLQEDKK